MLLGISGRAGAGKDIFAAVAIAEFGAQQISFASEVKVEAAAFMRSHGIEFLHKHLYGTQEDKEYPLYAPEASYPAFFGAFLYQFATPAPGGGDIFTPRSLLQFWGTEYRRSQDVDYWVKRALCKAVDSNILYVFSDTRFLNEVKAITDAKGKLVRIVRPGGPAISNMTHASETVLDTWMDWDFEILNSGTLEEYQEQCRDVLRIVEV